MKEDKVYVAYCHWEEVINGEKSYGENVLFATKEEKVCQDKINQFIQTDKEETLVDDVENFDVAFNANNIQEVSYHDKTKGVIYSDKANKIYLSYIYGYREVELF